MTQARDWSRLDELLDQALDQPPDKRREWLAEACGEDDALRSRVESRGRWTRLHEDRVLQAVAGEPVSVGRTAEAF